MNKRPWMIALTVVAVAVFIMMLLPGKRHFVWHPFDAYGPEDDEPFGCELFDKMAVATFPHGYSYFEGDIDTLLNSRDRRSLLVIANSCDWNSDFPEKIKKFVSRGNKLMVVSEYFYINDPRTTFKWVFDTETWGFFDKDSLRYYLTGNSVADTLRWPGGSAAVPNPLIGSYFTFSSPHEPTSFIKKGDGIDKKKKVHSVRLKVGKGEVRFVGSPLLFTNYGVLDPEISRYLSYELSSITDLPVMRVNASYLREDWEGTTKHEVSHFYYLLERPPMRWAFYTLCAAVALLMFFTARRRQRVIPVEELPASRNVEFVKLLGTLYYSQHGNKDLLRKKYTYFREELRRTQLLDIADTDRQDANIRQLSQTTGIDESEIAATLEMLRTLTADDTEVSDDSLCQCIDRVNKIIKHL